MALTGWNRREAAGSLGDLGTDLPLIAAMIIAAKLDAASVLILFGALQIMTGLLYRMPMPVQPLKAMAAIVIAQKLSPETLYGGGLAIGIMILVLAASGALGWLAKTIPTPVVRGVQFGLGMNLATLAGKEFIAPSDAAGWALAAVSIALVFGLWGNRRVPAALVVVGLGAIYSGIFDMDWAKLAAGVGLALPQPHVPQWSDIMTGLVVLALPQLPLSLANSLLATHRLAKDLFPERAPSMRKLGLTYSFMNLVSPFLSGIPTCHGSGGMAGHYAFGARVGASVVIYGLFYLISGLFFSESFHTLIMIFPKAILGVLLFIEGLALMRRVSMSGLDARGWMTTLITGLCAVGLPNGYLIGVAAGWIVFAISKNWELERD